MFAGLGCCCWWGCVPVSGGAWETRAKRRCSTVWSYYETVL